jgi:alpha-tubulin suppressor-like RCC1 family protein
VTPAASAGLQHTCALRADGAVFCWGRNHVGESTPPVGSFAQVSAGGEFTCGLRSTGTAQCWGITTGGRTTPPELPSGVRYTQLSTGVDHSCAVRTDGWIACWGDQTYGKSWAPIPAPGVTYTQVSSGDYHTCAVRNDGRVDCWGGLNDYGELTAPALPSSVAYTQVSAGGQNSCALRSDGQLACWGQNDYGQATPPAGLNLLVQTQSITFTSDPGDVGFVGGRYVASAIGGGSGNPVIFSSLSPAVCRVGSSVNNSATVSFTAAGSCVVAADQAGNASYAPAPRVTQGVPVRRGGYAP